MIYFVFGRYDGRKWLRCRSTSEQETSCHQTWYRQTKLLDAVLKNFVPNYLQMLEWIVNTPGWFQSPSQNVPNVLYAKENKRPGWRRKYRASLKTIHTNTCRVRLGIIVFNCTVGSKIIRALAIIIAIFFYLIANFYRLMLVINNIKPKNYDLTNI